MNSDGDNNSLRSIASISKTRKKGGEKEISARTGKKTEKEYLASREKGNQVETEG